MTWLHGSVHYLRIEEKSAVFFHCFQATGSAPLNDSDELYPDNINRLWHRFDHALQEREMAVQQEIIR